MGFGAIITSGKDDTVLGDELMKWLSEARVEQELSAPTRFAIRFEDDTCEGAFQVLNAAEIKPNTVLGILAQSGNRLVCLARGPITQVRFAVTLGVADLAGAAQCAVAARQRTARRVPERHVLPDRHRYRARQFVGRRGGQSAHRPAGTHESHRPAARPR